MCIKMSVIHVNLNLDCVLFKDYFYERRKMKMLILSDLSLDHLCMKNKYEASWLCRHLEDLNNVSISVLYFKLEIH